MTQKEQKDTIEKLELVLALKMNERSKLNMEIQSICNTIETVKNLKDEKK